MPFEISTVDKELIAKSTRFYRENVNAIRLFYRPLNDMFSFLFKKKVDNFYEKTALYFQVREEKGNALHNRISYAYATGDYSKNAIHHYYFNIDGKQHVYSIVELDMYGVIDKAEKISRQLADDKAKKQIPNNVLQFKR